MGFSIKIDTTLKLYFNNMNIIRLYDIGIGMEQKFLLIFPNESTLFKNFFNLTENYIGLQNFVCIENA